MPIRHTTVATGADDPSAEINKAEWNADHTAPDIADVTGLEDALDAKQDTLVSATNIKTINGSSVLGSGDLAISSSVSWGGITGTLSDQTDLQTALDAKANHTAGELLNPTLLDTTTPNKGWNFDFSGSFAFSIGTHVSWLTNDRTWTWPDKNGTVALVGGSDTQITFNDGGELGGDADFTWNKTTNTLGLVGTDTGIQLAGITTEPAPPAAGNLRIYSKSIAGRMAPKIVGPSGVDTPLQNAFWGNNITMWNATTATAGVWLGTAGAGAGSYSTALPTTTSLYTAMKRARWANVVTTLNQVLGQRNTEAMFFRGSVDGQGGFFFYARLGFDVWTNGGRFFAGMHSGTTVISADPSALNNTVGFAVDAADNGLIHFLTRSTSATKQSTGLTIVSGKGYDVYIFCAPNSSQYSYRIVDINTGTEYSNIATATLPTNTTMLTAGVLASNAALTSATAIQLGLNRIYVETDR